MDFEEITFPLNIFRVSVDDHRLNVKRRIQSELNVILIVRNQFNRNGIDGRELISCGKELKPHMVGENLVVGFMSFLRKSCDDKTARDSGYHKPSLQTEIGRASCRERV